MEAAASPARVVFAPEPDDALLTAADAVVGPVPPERLPTARRLRWIHSAAAGVDGYLSPELSASGIQLTSSVGNGAIPLAEHALMLMLMLSRDAPRWARAQAEHRWERRVHGELAGHTLGIVGLGHSGVDLAAKAKACHMRVVGVRRRAGLPTPAVDEVYGPEGLPRVLAAADFLVVTAPRTPATAGLIDAAALRLMKPTAFVICISRGGIIDEDALVTALREERLAGAGLDAHATEPLPADSPLWTLPNVIVTPHNGATTEATARRGDAILLENLRRFARGEPLVNVVDKEEGY
ncbi:D-2-hydroxyacid dehydrogenase [Streptomyces sp. TS71-3]|uniref:D-2-hydroxyacid dehydrogenase n=1 Tax=Streptomyces sp. TS71-3 TaxID=2733862 RepID=UPI001BB40C29|nr:D-2-hydroxyacid dehydrogenase [Streptomyces sp. TS71-3]